METEGQGTLKHFVKVHVTDKCDNCIYKDHSTTTTTTNLNKINGFSWDILEILNDNVGLTSNEIYDKLSAFNHEKNYIRVFLYNLRSYGILELRKSDSVWLITDPYTDYVKRIINNKYSKRSAKDEQNLSKRSAKDEQKITKKPILPKQTRQLKIELFLEKEDLDEDERVVVVALARHYEETGLKAKARPYIIVKDYYEFKIKTGLGHYRDEDVQDIAISLQSSGYLYIIQQGIRLKIGLTKETIEKMQNC